MKFFVFDTESKVQGRVCCKKYTFSKPNFKYFYVTYELSKNMMAKAIESNKIRNPSQKKITKLATIKGNLIPASLGSIPENLILL